MAVIKSKTRYGNIFHFHNDDPIGACLQHYGEWAQQELDFFDKFLRENSVVMDVGANIGTHTLFFAKKCSKGYVISFEPQLYIFNLLCSNIALNEIYNAFPYNAGVSDENTSYRCSIMSPVSESDKVNFGEWQLNDDAGKGGFTHIYKLDNYLDIVSNLDLIKIDVEGMESKVINGAKQLVNKFKPVLYCEFSQKNGDDNLLETLESIDYIPYLHIYYKHNINNFNKTQFNVWEEEGFVLTKDNMHKRFDASIFCVHKDGNQPTGLYKISKGESLYTVLKDSDLID